MERIVIFGGTFNPIHIGHLKMALSAASLPRVTRVLLIPACRPPHKSDRMLAGEEDRLAMCRLAVRDYPHISVSDMEIRRGGASFTVDTLTALREEYSSAELCLLCGADMFVTLSQWKRYRDIIRLATIFAVPRDGTDQTLFMKCIGAYSADGARIEQVEMPPVEISSSEIRRRLSAGLPAEELLPAGVPDYIRQHKLYEVKTKI